MLSVKSTDLVEFAVTSERLKKFPGSTPLFTTFAHYFGPVLVTPSYNPVTRDSSDFYRAT